MKFRQISTGLIMHTGNQEAEEIMLASDAYTVISDDTDSDSETLNPDITEMKIPDESGDTEPEEITDVESNIEHSEPDASPKKYTSEALEEMTISAIRELAEQLGYNISGTRKSDIITEFLEQQG